MFRPRTRALAALEPESAKLDGLATYQERKKVESAARGTAANAPYTPASTDLTRERDSAQASASHTEPTSVGLGIDKLTREIYACRSKSADLVESVFGCLVDVDSAADILHDFLDTSILSVHKEVDGKLRDVAKKNRKAACAAAAIQANEAVTPSRPSSVDQYRWTWNLNVEASETSAALLLNVVAIAAHAAAIRSGKAHEHPLPSLRFITLPDPHQAVPLSNDSAAQDCRPDVMAFDCSAFCAAPNTTAPTNQFLLPDSPFDFIRKNFPTVLKFTLAQKAADGLAISAFERWFNEQERHKCLDMSRFCWPEAQLAVEAKLSDSHNAILQELDYMRQQRRTQPWMKFIIGLIMTTKVVGLLRADTLGIEQCTFPRDSSRGVLDTVRICLGMVRSTCLQRGQHEAFELSDTTTLAPHHLQFKVTRHSKTQPSTTAVDFKLDVFAAEDLAEGNIHPAENPAMEYTHRTVRFIKLRGDRIHFSHDGTRPDVTYYVHHVVQNDGSLVGRCPRIFCVSRETKSEDNVRRFVGPYALKVYHADHANDCYRDDLIDVARKAQVQNVLLPTWEWYYGDALSMRGFPPDVVKKYTDIQAATVVPSVVSNREEVFAQSDLKRLLVQCSGYEEFVLAFIDFVKDIASLAEKNLAHRDLSIGNVLLSQDTPCSPSFFSDAEASAESIIGTTVAFTQRALEPRMGGLRHDLDMAGRVPGVPEKAPADSRNTNLQQNLEKKLNKEPPQPERPAQLIEPQKQSRTGTLPFMAPRLLVKGPPHFVAYDLHSLLFVMVLFFWSHPTFLSNIPFPQSVPERRRNWPQEVLRWVNCPGCTLTELGALKRGFFSIRSTLGATLQRTLSGDSWTEDSAYLNLFWALYGVLWRPWDETADSEDEDSEWVDRRRITPAEVEAALTAQYRQSVA